VTLSVLVFQHDLHDGPGYLGEALLQRGAKLEIVRLDLGESVADPTNYDMLLVMGGAMNVYQDDQYPWLTGETRAIRQAVDRGKAVLGVCLGGQLLAKALDAQVHVGAATEIGLIPITLTETGKADPFFEGLSELEAVEWHDDSFDIPTGAVALASSEGCAHQAFRFGERAYGLQFHPEVSPRMLAEWIKEAGEAPVDGDSFQGALEAKVVALQTQADRLIDNFVRTCIPSPDDIASQASDQ
jgi:GMP synthase-like glutamine amidotransferase